MKTSNDWIRHFKINAQEKRIDWNLSPTIKKTELDIVLPSLQAWQLGETSEGKNLIKAATRYAEKIDDAAYLEAIKLFIVEEQKHGNNLGRYLDLIGQPRIKKDWGDSLFRRVRYFNASMEIWTLAVIVVESTAQIFYQALKDATDCKLLKQICTDILIDEAHHIKFQNERLAMIFNDKTSQQKQLRKRLYRYAFYSISLTVWAVHRKLFKAGGNTFSDFQKKMQHKYLKTINVITDDMNMLFV